MSLARPKRRKRRKKAAPCSPKAKALKKTAKRKARKKAPVCKPKRRPVKKRTVPAHPKVPAAPAPAPAVAAPAAPPAPPPPPPPPAIPHIESPIAKYSGTFGVPQAERLLWRAGFGPKKGQAAELASLGLEKAVMSLTRPVGPAKLTGPEPHRADGLPLAPIDSAGDDHAYWLDRMIRTDQPLVERMALIFHDWFATSLEAIHLQEWILEQTNLFRQHSLGSFADLISAITVDRAMIYWLSNYLNLKGRINENYARELMELFTLGADRGAYTEEDVREAARALSGFRAVDGDGYPAYFVFTPTAHDSGVKTLFGKTGKFGWTDVCRMVVEHPMHASFFVEKLWSYFIPTPPSDAVLAALAERYVSSGHQIRPVVEAILCSPEFYTGARMVKPPVVFNAGLLRMRDRYIERSDWYWYSMMAGQRLYWPPDVSGWNDKRWLDTNTLRARWKLVSQTFVGETIADIPQHTYDPTETPQLALKRALEFWGNPSISQSTYDELLAFAQSNNSTSIVKARRQNALRQLIPCTPDYQTS
jgi:hypothetical protein